MVDKKKVMSVLASIGLAEAVPDAHEGSGVAAPPMATGGPVHGAVAAGPYTAKAAPGTTDPDVLAKLEKRLQSNCPAAYTAFTEQYEALQPVIPDDATRFRAAIVASHTTAADLVAALDQLVAAMDAAKSEFAHTFDETKSRRLGESETSLKATDDLIASSEQQLKSLEDTIASLRTKREADAQALQHEGQRLESIRANFEASHAQVVGRLQAQKSRVQTMPKV